MISGVNDDVWSALLLVVLERVPIRIGDVQRDFLESQLAQCEYICHRCAAVLFEALLSSSSLLCTCLSLRMLWMSFLKVVAENVSCSASDQYAAEYVDMAGTMLRLLKSECGKSVEDDEFVLRCWRMIAGPSQPQNTRRQPLAMLLNTNFPQLVTDLSDAAHAAAVAAATTTTTSTKTDVSDASRGVDMLSSFVTSLSATASAVVQSLPIASSPIPPSPVAIRAANDDAAADDDAVTGDADDEVVVMNEDACSFHGLDEHGDVAVLIPLPGADSIHQAGGPVADIVNVNGGAASGAQAHEEAHDDRQRNTPSPSVRRPVLVHSSGSFVI